MGKQKRKQPAAAEPAAEDERAELLRLRAEKAILLKLIELQRKKFEAGHGKKTEPGA